MKKRKITRKTFALTATIGSLFIVAFLAVNTLWASRQTIKATEDAVSVVSSFYLEAMADRRAKTITNLIDNNFNQMEKALAVLTRTGISTQEELRSILGSIKSLLSLNRFALIDENDIVYTQYTTYTGKSRHAFLSNGQMKDRVISTAFLYGSSKQLCLAVPTDIIIMGKQFKACFVQIDIKDIVDLLAFDDQERTNFALYSQNGENLSGTELGPVILDHNIFEATKDLFRKETWDEFCKAFAEEKSGSLTSVSNGAQATMFYAPIKEAGWQLAVLIRESVIHEQIHAISEQNTAVTKYQVIFILISVLILAVILLVELGTLSKARLEAEKENTKVFESKANTDSLTGIRNKYAYSETEALLDRKIKENEIKKLGIVVCDINGLKYVNDTFGHAAGDKLIKDASTMICDYFRHGSVFRIGGDEFVVVLQDRGYDTMNEVLANMNRKVEENIRENAVVVSIGHSVLGQEDTHVRDVFERADQLMYERKKELKAMGAKTRDA